MDQGYRNASLVDVWRVDRHGEATRFAQHAGMSNRKLLFHGTRCGVGVCERRY